MNCAEEKTAFAAAMLEVQGVADLLSCSPRHVRRLADRGAMPRPVALGRLRHWNADAIRAWIAEGCPNVSRRGGRAK